MIKIAQNWYGSTKESQTMVLWKRLAMLPSIPATIGARGGNNSSWPTTVTGSQPWIGSMSEMVWYQNRTLTTSAIGSLYNGGYTFNIFDKSMAKPVPEATIRQEYNELGLSSGSYSHYPTDLLTDLMAYYRFHQFSGFIRILSYSPTSRLWRHRRRECPMVSHSP